MANDGEARPRPLIPLAGAAILGILSGPHVPFSAALLFVVLVAVALVAVALAWWEQTRLATAAAILAFGCLGVGAYRLAVVDRPADHISRLPEALLGRPLSLRGRVIGPPEEVPAPFNSDGDAAARVRLLVAVEGVQGAQGWPGASGTARVTIRQALGTYRRGDSIEGTFLVRPPQGFRNPGGFDYGAYLVAQGIFLEAWGSDETSIRRHVPGGWSVLRAVDDLRGAMLRALDRAYPGIPGALLRAIVLGDRTGLTPEVNDAFLRSGTYHIMAISGLNVSLLAGTLFFVLRLLFVPIRVRACLSLIAVSLYAVLAGGGASVVRAAVMADAYLLAILLDREADLLNTVALSALALLLWNPLWLWDVGFQLTFAATLGIILTIERFPMADLPRLVRGLADSLLISVAAFAATLPILAATFHRTSVVGIAANLPIVPLSGILTATGLLSMVLLVLLPGGLPPLETLNSWLLEVLLRAARLFAALPGALVGLPGPSVAMTLAYYGALLGLVAWGRKRLGWLTGALSAAALLLLVAHRFHPVLSEPRLRLTVLDVGQGDGMVLELPDRRTMVVDAGGRFDEAYDVGERVMIPFLWHRWVRRIDVLVLSHPHPDHLNGLRAVLQTFPVGEVWDGGWPVRSPRYLWFLEELRERRIPQRVVEAGWDWDGGGGLQVAVLHPMRPFLSGSKRGHYSDVNSNSIVLRLRYGETVLLLTGDIEEEAERVLLDRLVPLRAAVLKVPHHGGRTSSSDAFLTAVAPRYAFVSAGARNRFRHPHAETLARYRNRGIRLWRTDGDGAVMAETNGRDLAVWGFAGGGAERTVAGGG